MCILHKKLPHFKTVLTKRKKGIAFLFVRIYNELTIGNVTGYVADNVSKKPVTQRQINQFFLKKEEKKNDKA